MIVIGEEENRDISFLFYLKREGKRSSAFGDKGWHMEHKTGLEDAYVIKDNKRLRMGYTTGSCAAAAAKAGTRMLLGEEYVEEAALMTPKGILLHLLIEDIQITRGDDGRPREVSCAVRKDGGDDPDATHGILIYATVRKCPPDPGKPTVVIDGGPGVGRVTKPGLAEPVGAAAINPVPRQMIDQEVRAQCSEFSYTGGIQVTISIPKGEQIAAKTFNPRLGILGGLSVLGTSGIVVPMSEDALLASIRLEMQMLVESGARYLLITPGNYGEAFASQMPELDRSFEMKCSNYVGETIDMAVELGVKGILFVAHIGKFIKVSGGIMNTHSKNADSRAELMTAAYLRAGGSLETARGLLETITTEEALDLIRSEGKEMLADTMRQVCEKIEFYLQNRCKGAILTQAVIFSQVHGKLGETSQVQQMLGLLKSR